MVEHYVTGAKPPGDRLVKMASVLGVSPAYLETGRDEIQVGQINGPQQTGDLIHRLVEELRPILNSLGSAGAAAADILQKRLQSTLEGRRLDDYDEVRAVVLGAVRDAVNEARPEYGNVLTRRDLAWARLSEAKKRKAVEIMELLGEETA